MSALKKLAAGMGWGTASTLCVAGFQLLFMAVLARLLDPAAFGLIALANIGLRLMSYFAQSGIGPALVQRKDLDDSDFLAAFQVAIFTSLVFTVAAYFIAPGVAWFFDSKDLIPVFQALAGNFILSAVLSVSQNILRRQAQFKTLAINDAVSYVIGYGVVGISAAMAGFGVWSLVLALASQLLVNVILCYWRAQHPLWGSINKEKCVFFLSFGSKYSLIGLFEYFSMNLDSILVGKFLGTNISGQYNRAQLLAHLPVMNLVNVFCRTMFPLMSQSRNQGHDIRVPFMLGCFGVAMFAFPIGIFLSVAAEQIVLIVLGPQWTQAIDVLMVLGLTIGWVYLNQFMTMTLDVLALIQLKLKLQFAFLLIALLTFTGFGWLLALKGILIAILVVEFIRFVVLSLTYQRQLKLTKNDVVPVSSALLIQVVAAAVGVMAGSLIANHVQYVLFQMFILSAMFLLCGIVGLYYSLRIMTRSDVYRGYFLRNALITYWLTKLKVTK